MKVDKNTGEILSNDLDPKCKVVTTIRPDGSTAVGFDFTGCPSKTEPHHYNETNINYLIQKYKPDELVMYLQSRNPNRAPQFKDFTIEPSFQDAKNIHYKLNEAFKKLPESLQGHFGNVMNYMKFIDNPDNIPALKQMGLLPQTKTKKQNTPTQTTTTPTQTTTTPTTTETKTETPAPQGAT